MKKFKFLGVTVNGINGKFTIKVLLFAVTILALLVSCGGGSKVKTFKEPIQLKPFKTAIINMPNDSYNLFPENRSAHSISKYIEIIDGTYSMTLEKSVGSYGGDAYRIDVKVKSLQKANKNDEFKIEESSFPGRTELFLVDNAGAVIGDDKAFKIKNIDVLKDFLSSGETEGLLRFQIDAYDLQEYVKTPKIFAGFLIKTSAYKKTAENTEVQSEESPSTDVKVKTTGNAGNENWDNILNSYEKYITQYVALLKKANAGDMSAMTEYASMMEKATEFADKLENVSDDLSPSQSARFLKLQTKLLNAASGL